MAPARPDPRRLRSPSPPRLAPPSPARGSPARRRGEPVLPGAPTPRGGGRGIPHHPRAYALPRRRTETRQTRPRPATRLEEPPPGAHPQRRQDQRQDITTAVARQVMVSAGTGNQG